jgi:CBS domain-containing protein
MTVARILNSKGRKVVTTNPQASLQEIAQQLTQNKIGALIVVNAQGEIEGIISERDIVAAIANYGALALADAASRHMTVQPPAIEESDSVDGVMELMTEQRRRHLPVVQGGRLAGLVSIGDVVKYRIETIEYERKALRDYITSA